MLIKEEGAAVTSEQRQEAEASDTTYYCTISDLIGQLFRIAYVINVKSPAAVFATYLDGKVNLSIVIRGESFDLIKDQEAGISVLTRALNFLEVMEAMLCGRD